MKKLLAITLSIAFAVAPVFASAAVIPTGRAYSGDLNISSGTVTDNTTESNITALASAGASSVTVASVSGFAAGNYVMVIQVAGTGFGAYEFQKIQSINGSVISFPGVLANTYQSTGAEVIKVSEYHNVNITGGTWTASAWNGTVGGVLVAFLTGSLNEGGGGTITMTGNGGSASTNGAAGSAAPNCSGAASGGSGGNANAGSTGGVFCSSGTGSPGSGGGAGGSATLSTMVMGGGGGGGATGCCSILQGSPGAGAGIIFFSSASSTIGGTFTDAGGAGQTLTCGGNGEGGAGGAGGSIRIPAVLNLTLGSGINAAAGGGGGGCNYGSPAGSTGRIATVSAASVSGTTNPTINTASTDYVYNVDNTAVSMTAGSSF